MVSEPVLRIGKLVKTFGAFRALDELTLEVHAGEILGLVGPNGSGKTTCINVVSGLYPPNGGRVLLGERSVGGLRAHKLVHLGINRTFQVPKPFMQLTARENVAVARSYGAGAAGGPSTDSLLHDLNLESCAGRPAVELNSAQQKMLDLARALATGPKLLLVDELAAGLNPAELDWIAAKLRVLARSGMAVVVVEHLMGFIEQVTDRVVVMNAGREIFGGTLGEAVADPRVVEVFLGKPHAVRADAPVTPAEAPLLAAQGLTAGYGPMQVLWGVDLAVVPGETVLLLGANGAGKTTTLKVLVGLLAAGAGAIHFAGRDITRARTDKRVRAGIAYMSELGVFPDLTIAENIRVGAQSVSRSEAARRADELYVLFPVLREKRRQAASSLSGGQRKMLGIAKALASAPRLLVMDEPSAGLSPLFVGEVLRALSSLRGKGLSLLVAEQNIGFLDIADRVLVLEGGRIRFTGTVSEMNGDADLRKAYFGLK